MNIGSSFGADAQAGGDDGALRVLFSRHAPWLASRLSRVLPAAAVADVLQETFVAARRGISPTTGPGRGCGASRSGNPRCGCERAGQPLLPPVDTVAPDDPESAAVDRVGIAEAVASLSGEDRRRRTKPTGPSRSRWPKAQPLG